MKFRPILAAGLAAGGLLGALASAINSRKLWRAS